MTMNWKRSTRCAGNGSCVEAAGAEFRKAARSFTSGNCVEAGSAAFRSASRSFNEANCAEAAGVPFRKAAGSQSNGHCAETGHEDGVIFLRDSKDAGENFPHLHYTVSEWDGGRGVRFHPVPGDRVPGWLRGAALERGHHPHDSWYIVHHPSEDTALWFVQGEKDAFEAGVADGEFELETAGGLNATGPDASTALTSGPGGGRSG